MQLKRAQLCDLLSLPTTLPCPPQLPTTTACGTDRRGVINLRDNGGWLGEVAKWERGPCFAGGRNRGEGDVNLLLLILERRGTGKDAL